MGKKWFSAVKWPKNATFPEEVYLERQILKKMRFSLTAIHQAIIKTQNFWWILQLETELVDLKIPKNNCNNTYEIG